MNEKRLSGAVWRSSSYSSGNGQCVEVAYGSPGEVPLRDGKCPDGPVLAFSRDGWESFVAFLHDGGLRG